MRLRHLWTMSLGLVLLAGCADSPTTPSTISSGTGGTTTATNLSGSWSGTASDPAGAFRMAWQLAQVGRNVTGTVTGTTPVGAPLYTRGTFSGTLSGTDLTFTIEISAGGVVDAPQCSVRFTGTARDVTSTSLLATYTGEDSCLGPILDGRATMLKE